MKIRFYCDNGANIHSRREEVIDAKDLGLDEGEWESLGQYEKEEIARDWAYERLEYGWEEL